MVATLWIDVEDLFEYFRNNARPTGIQRLVFELYQVLQQRDDGRGLVRFVRHDPVRGSLRIVQWAEVAGLFTRVAAEIVPPQAQPGAIRPHSPVRQFFREWTHRLPAVLRIRVTEVMLSQVKALQAWGKLFALLGRCMLDSPRWLAQRYRADADRTSSGAAVSRQSFADLAKPGDVLLVLGAPWSHPNYGALVHAQRERYGLRIALLIHDLIPLRRPEWCERGLVRLFRAWFDGVFPLADHLFAVSKATASDVEHYAREHGVALSGPVIPVPIGTGFGAKAPAVPVPPTARLPAPGSYALIVSTIEVRKNHLLLFRVWRRLLEELPHDQVPILVFAGRAGWLVGDLMEQIANTDHLGGKLVVIPSPTDAELTALYQGCLFTLFPSLFEGWGLPVTESLAFGKPCLISNRTSLPEAGGALARSFDPDNLHDAYAVILEAITDRAGLAAWEAQIRREFKPVPWSATVDALLRGLDHPLASAIVPDEVLEMPAAP
ncbi:MAG TPA: glycosyltransferase family 1 protein [Aliidongia sp.]|nr:glycosyltransferase family 1 protein [Aliidongia sp.]